MHSQAVLEVAAIEQTKCLAWVCVEVQLDGEESAWLGEYGRRVALFLIVYVRGEV